jgi:hypothetical protein
VVSSFAASEQSADVYNLTIDAAHEFFANGVLVHNCDALRYLAINLGAGPSFPIFNESPADPESRSLQLLSPTVAVVAPPTDWWDDEEKPVRGATATSPFI